MNVIPHPDQNVELTCDVTGGSASWFINGQGPYLVSHFFIGKMSGYNISGNSLIIKDKAIVMNDPSNGYNYQCVIAAIYFL